MKNFKRNRQPQFTIHDFIIQNLEYLQDLYNDKHPDQSEKSHYENREIQTAQDIMIDLYSNRIQ